MSWIQTEGTSFIPAVYGDNKVVLMARDPHYLYAYWEISNDTKQKFFRDFGYELWDNSVPVLKVTNVSNNKSFYIQINDYTNNRYIHVDDSNSQYIAELGRRVSEEFFINLAGSNYVDVPGETVSSDTTAYFIDYRDLRNGRLDYKSGKIYETHGIKSTFMESIGLSSQAFFEKAMQESVTGVSSAHLLGANITELMGISSESFK